MNDEMKIIFNIIESIGTGTKDKQNLINFRLTFLNQSVTEKTA